MKLTRETKTEKNLHFSERQRELKRISNMIDDIIATKWSRIAEKTVRIDIHFDVEAEENGKKHPVFLTKT